jgi:hypothetical protein
MTRLISILLAALAVGGATAQAGGESSSRKSVAVVLAGNAATRADLIAALKGVTVRVPRSGAEQLAVTHLLAAQGVRRVIGVGLDRRVAVEPVARRYPGTRFESVAADVRALRRAVGRG